MRHSACRRPLWPSSMFFILQAMLLHIHAQTSPGPIQSSQTVAILEDVLYVHGGSRQDSFLESGCVNDFWRMRIGQSEEWNISSSVWEVVQPMEIATTLPPVSGLGLKTLLVPGNHTAHITNGTVAHADNTSPFLIEFGRAGCANDEQKDKDKDGKAKEGRGLSGIVFNIYNPVMNSWQVVDLVNMSEILTSPIVSGLNATALVEAGNWLTPVVAVDYVSLVWYIILQSTVPLRQLILKKDITALTKFMEEIDLTEDARTKFPEELLFEDWEMISDMEEKAPFVSRGVATFMRDSIVIISGTANAFTPNDAVYAELRGCDHAYLFSTVDRTWKRQDLTVANNGILPEPREKAAFIAVGPKIYMYGGIKPYQVVLQDMWVLDTETWIWTRLADGPGPRADHTLLQYHEYLFVVSGSNVGRNIPMENVLPLMAFNTNSSEWTNTIRATVGVEATFISNVTRLIIIIGTVLVAIALLVASMSTHILKKWNQRSYSKVDETFQLEEQRRRNGVPELPSILKKRHLAEIGQNSITGGGRDARQGSRKVRGLRTEVIFEDVEYSDQDLDEDSNEDSGEEEYEVGFRADDEDDHRVHKVSLLSRPQPMPSSRARSRQHEVDVYADDSDRDEKGLVNVDDEKEKDEEEEEEDDDTPVIVHFDKDNEELL
ncbi:hypothetical protein BGZ94_008132 [Podila epigama]|nr:hypothetical protein BGZ94_008132 [Podila epigama]